MKFKFLMKPIIRKLFKYMVKIYKKIYVVSHQLYTKRCLNREFLNVVKNITSKIIKTWNHQVRSNSADVPVLLLGTTPYSENLNYMMAISTDAIEIKHFKIVLEVLKISTIVGCLSNFMIYVMLGKKVRNIILQKLPCNVKTPQENIMSKRSQETHTWSQK